MTNKHGRASQTTHDNNPEAIAAAIDDANRRAQEAAADLARLALLARGTRERVSPPARPAGQLEVPAGRGHATAPIERRIEAALRRQVMSPAELARALGEPVVRVVTSLGSAKVRPRVHNAGTEARPRLSWVIGDHGPTPELNDLVERLLRERPYTFAELLEATGAREGRVSGAIVRLQRLPRERGAPKIANLGEPNKARWFLRDGAGERQR